MPTVDTRHHSWMHANWCISKIECASSKASCETAHYRAGGAGHMSDAPSTVARYQIRRRLGHGTMGVVYHAYDPALGRDVALKLAERTAPSERELDEIHWMSPHIQPYWELTDSEWADRFLAEARATSGLLHENIVETFDMGRHEGLPFVCMEYLSGESLTQRIERRRGGAVDERLAILDALCAGLEYAHACGVVHRDVRPANIMFTDRGVVKIVDFGLEDDHLYRARRYDRFDYISPERVMGQSVDQRTDIFSAGVTCYHLLADKHPFIDPLQREHVFVRIADSPHLPLQSIVPEVGREISDIVDRMLAKQPADRYQDFTVIRQAIAKARQLSSKRPHRSSGKGSHTGGPRGHAAAECELGEQALLDGDGDRAFDHAQRARSFAPNDRRVVDLLARARAARVAAECDAGERALRDGDPDRAYERIERALVITPQDARAVDLRERARAAMRDRYVQHCLAEARRHLAAGALTAAAEWLERARQFDPNVPALPQLRQALHHAREEEAEEAKAREETAAARQLFAEGNHDIALARLRRLGRKYDFVRVALEELTSAFERIRNVERKQRDKDPRPQRSEPPPAPPQVEARPNAGDLNYRNAVEAARRGHWAVAFAELKLAMRYSHPDAQACLNRMWCQRCRLFIAEPSPVSAMASYASFWNGMCPRCSSRLMPQALIWKS